MVETVGIIFFFIVLIFSTMIHEISHGFVAEKLGDSTARLAGRLTLNPLSHIDPFGSILLPLLLYIGTGGAIMFGWAKPVPYDPRFLKHPKADAGKIAVAGPASNLLLAVVFGIGVRTASLFGANPVLIGFFDIIVYTNLLLAVFNLVPLAPLDGSKVLYAFLPPKQGTYRFVALMERYGIFVLLFFILFGFGIIQPVIRTLYALIAGAGGPF